MTFSLLNFFDDRIILFVAGLYTRTLSLKSFSLQLRAKAQQRFDMRRINPSLLGLFLWILNFSAVFTSIRSMLWHCTIPWRLDDCFGKACYFWLLLSSDSFLIWPRRCGCQIFFLIRTLHDDSTVVKSVEPSLCLSKTPTGFEILVVFIVIANSIGMRILCW